MNLKDAIIFLGTGGDAIVVGKQLRASGGIVLRFGNNQFHLDPGPGALVRAHQFGVNPRETTAIMLSHGHLNHAADVNVMISAMTYSGIDKHGVLVCDEESLNGSDEEYPVISKYHRRFVERFIALKPNMKIGINEVNIVSTTAKHTNSSIGYKFFTDKFTVSYTGDTDYCKELVDEHKGSDVMIINCKLPFGISEKGHLNSEDVVKLLKKTNPKLAILTGFGVKLLEANPIYEVREIQKLSGVQVVAAKDGMSVSPAFHSTNLKQKKLRSY